LGTVVESGMDEAEEAVADLVKVSTMEWCSRSKLLSATCPASGSRRDTGV